VTKTSAIHLRTCAASGLAALAVCLAAPVLAAEDVTETTPSVRDVAMTPLTDLNLDRDEIPQVLIDARMAPYANDGLNQCGEIRREVGDLDAVLGDDFDTAPPDERGITPTGVAQRVVSFFIPFRGIIREVSGANSHEYEFREAIAAGLMRRAYLKGMGQQMGCPYPASPASSELLARLRYLEEDGEVDYAAEAAQTTNDGTQFVSRPVIQNVD